ncbi:MAG: hypothetical protein KDA31_07305 [Phycisphaerales bacterium]|nr:hypothetical protein [Phycisphaerales bacterium]
MRDGRLLVVLILVSLVFCARASGWDPEFEPWIWPATIAVGLWGLFVALTRRRAP